MPCGFGLFQTAEKGYHQVTKAQRSNGFPKKFMSAG
jgi:hypothetical protein